MSMNDYNSLLGHKLGMSQDAYSSYLHHQMMHQQLSANAQAQQQAFQAIAPLNNKNEVDLNEKLLLLIEE